MSESNLREAADRWLKLNISAYIEYPQLKESLAQEMEMVTRAAQAAALEAIRNHFRNYSGEPIGRIAACRIIDEFKAQYPDQQSALAAQLDAARREGHLVGLDRAAKVADASSPEDSKHAARRIRTLIDNMQPERVRASRETP